MKTPVLSIVIPAFNTGIYAKRLLTSIKETCQDLDFEVIVINDGSTDSTAEEFKFYLKKLRIPHNLISQENRGHGPSCNLGLEIAEGKFIIFVDSDDWIDSTLLDSLHSFDSKTDVMIGGLVYESGSANTSIFHPCLQNGLLRADSEQIKNHLLVNWATPAGRIYRLESLRKSEVKFPNTQIFSDVGFCLALYRSGLKFSISKNSWYHYDISRNGQSLRESSPRVMQLLPSLAHGLNFVNAERSTDDLYVRIYVWKHIVSWTGRVSRLKRNRIQSMNKLWKFPRKNRVRGLGSSTVRIFSQSSNRKAFLVRSSILLRGFPVIVYFIVVRIFKNIDWALSRILLQPYGLYSKMRSLAINSVSKIVGRLES